MGNNAPMFSPDDDDPFFAEIIHGLVTEGKPVEEIDQQLQAALPKATAEASAHLLERLKARAGEMLSGRRGIASGFLKRQREKWGKPLDQLFMLLEAAREVG